MRGAELPIAGCCPSLPAVMSQATAPASLDRLSLPDATGHFGEYGGVFVPETLMTALQELDRAYEAARQDPAFLADLGELAPDCCPVVAYGAMLPPAALTVASHGWVNLHFSLLPAWRGAAPVQRAILAGDEITGASTFQIEAGLDTGPVFGVITEAIKPTDTAGDLLARLAVSGARLLLATMNGIEDGTLVAAPQSLDGVSSAAKLSVDDAHIDWSMPAFAIDRRVRACTPAPGAWTTFRGERLKLGPVRRVDATGSPGELTAQSQAVWVATGSGAVELGVVQPAGKRMIPAPGKRSWPVCSSRNC